MKSEKEPTLTITSKFLMNVIETIDDFIVLVNKNFFIHNDLENEKDYHSFF